MRQDDLGDDPEDSAHPPGERARASTRSTWVNVGPATTQVIVGIVARSQGLIAEGVHSLSDLVADIVLLFAGHHSREDADADHPCGHRRFEPAASLALGVLLPAVGVCMLWSEVNKLEAPETVLPVGQAALWVSAVALATKELLFRYMLAVAKRVKPSMLVANAWHARSDAAPSLVVGLGIAGNMAGYPILDPIAALIVGFVVARMGWPVGWDAMHDLMDRAVDDAEVVAIRRTLQEAPGVRDVHDIADLARRRVLERHRVLNLMTHVDPWRQPTPPPMAVDGRRIAARVT